MISSSYDVLPLNVTARVTVAVVNRLKVVDCIWMYMVSSGNDIKNK